MGPQAVIVWGVRGGGTLRCELSTYLTGRLKEEAPEAGGGDGVSSKPPSVLRLTVERNLKPPSDALSSHHRKADGDAASVPAPKNGPGAAAAGAPAAASAAAAGGGSGGSGFAFPRFEVDEGRGSAQAKGGKKPSKEQLLRQAEAKAKERAEAPEESKVRG